MTAQWNSPTVIEQYAEEGAEAVHVAWNDEDLTSGGIITTNGNLLHIARSPKVDFTNKTYFLKMTGFNFNNIPETVSGIELTVNVKRHGRVMDDTIQLTLNGSDIGDNQATLALDLTKSYGGVNNTWGITNLTAADVADPSFGIVLRFKAHPQYPHRDGANLVSVQLQIH